MDISIPAGSGFSALFKAGLAEYRDWRFENALRRLEEGGLSPEDFVGGDARFSSFMKFCRALEVCCSQTNLDVLIDVLVNGVKNGSVDDKPDVFQIVLSAVGDMTESEIKILAKMHELGMYEDSPGDMSTVEESRQLEDWFEGEMGLSKGHASSIVNGMQKYGFVYVRQPTWAGEDCYFLTELAKELITLIHYKTVMY